MRNWTCFLGIAELKLYEGKNIEENECWDKGNAWFYEQFVERGPTKRASVLAKP